MAEKRVSVRLSATGGRQVKAELEGIGNAGKQSFGRLSKEMEAANARLASFSRAARRAAAIATAAAVAAGVAMIRTGLQTVDAQAKQAQYLGTTVASIQGLERAGDLAGVSISGVEQATKDLTRRLSQAAAGTGPAAKALDQLGLSANDLMALPLDERVGAINAAIEEFVPVAERAAVAGQLFGEEGSIAMSRIDTATLRQATDDVRDLGVVVSEQDADQIERTNDAISRLGLIWRGVSNQLAVAAARSSVEDGANALDAASIAADQLNTALTETGTNPALDATTSAAGRAGGALSSAADVAKQAWEGANAAIERTKEIASGVANDITGPLKEALKSGELSWQTFAGAVSSIAQNLANRLIDNAFKPQAWGRCRVSGRSTVFRDFRQMRKAPMPLCLSRVPANQPGCRSVRC